MQVVGFNFTKVSSEKSINFQRGITISTNIEFTDMEKEKSPILKESDIIKLLFKYSVIYGDKEKKEEKQGEILFEGLVLLSTEKEETKSFTKSWKKKGIPKGSTVPLYNFILKKCSVKALQMEEEIGLPSHLPLPQVKPKQ